MMPLAGRPRPYRVLVLALVHASLDAVADALRAAEDADAVTGPTSDCGWTPVWIDEIAPLVPLGAVVAVDEIPPARLALATWNEGVRTGWAGDVGDPPAAHLQAAARAACTALGRPDAAAGLARLMVTARTGDEIAEACAALVRATAPDGVMWSVSGAPPAVPGRRGARWTALRNGTGADGEARGAVEPWLRPRWAQVVLAVLAVVAAVVCLLLATVQVVVIATDGVGHEESGTTGDDWAFAAVSSIGALASLWCARQLWKHRRFF